MSSRHPDAASSSISAGRTSPTICSRNGTRCASNIHVSSPYSCLRLLAIALVSRRAWASVTPSRRRPMTCQLCAVRKVEGLARSRGTHRSTPAGKSTDAGITPMTRSAWSPILRRVPNAVGVPPSARRQKPLLTSTTGAPPTCCSSGRKARPRTGWTPSTVKKSRDTTAKRARSASLAVATETVPLSAYSASIANDRLSAPTSRKFRSENWKSFPF